MIEPLPDKTTLELPARFCEWDGFVKSNIYGQYQQSTMWGNYKRVDGWNPFIRVIKNDSQIIGGYLLLVKKTIFGSFGYIAKGPLAYGELGIEWDREINEVMEKLNLLAVILQPPDGDSKFWGSIKEKCWHGVPTLGIIDMTLILPLEEFRNYAFGKIHRSKRQKIRQSMKSDLIIREGRKEDLPVFFRLMSATCRRQKAKSINPSSIQHLERLWDAFENGKHLRLTLAEIEGEAIASQLCILYGSRMTIWKKGWSGDNKIYYPNDYICFEGISWASNQDFNLCDFGGLSTNIGNRLLAGEALLPGQIQSRDTFNLSFGGQPLSIPQACIRFRSRFIEATFQLLEPIIPMLRP